MQLLQRDLHHQLRDSLAATRERIASLVRPLDQAKLNEHPEPKGWSVAQVLEHLCRAAEQYEKPVRRLLSGSAADAGAAAREWKPSFIGGRIAASLENPKPLKFGPPAFRPGPTARNGVVEAFRDGELRFGQTINDALSYDWRNLRLRSPALPFFLPKMNLGDALRIHVVHVVRHSRQIERLVKQL
jgi:DinB superfamily